MDGYYDSPVKRSHYDDDDEPDREDRDGRHKRHRFSDSEQLPPSVDIVYRLLCPIPKIGAIIGKGGSIVKSLRQDTGAKIRVEDAVPGAEERVVFISSSPGQDMDRDGRLADNDTEDMLCAAQDALFRIHERITEGEGPPEEDEEEDEPPRQVTVRLLVPSGQIGCVIGKQGRIIEQMRRDIPAQIRVLQKTNLPPCAFSTDELVQISGTPALVRKALYAVSSKLYDNPPRERIQGPSFYTTPPGGSYIYGAGGPMMGPGPHGRAGPGNAWPGHTGRPDGFAEEELMVCVLCPNEKIGKMIGKGGSVIRKLREDSGAKIKVCDPVEDSDERIIEVSALEYIDNFVSPVVEATMQIHKRLQEFPIDKESRNSGAIIKLLVRSSQIGCLLGKGGQIITDMRKSTRANIRIPPKEELPRCADEGSELVQISGDPRAVEAALAQVLSRLRTNLFKVTPVPHQGVAPIMPSYGGRDEPASPGGMYSHSGYDHGNYNTSPGGTGIPTSSGRSSKDLRRRQR